MKSTKTDAGKILLIGIGNSGRKDDGLGWKLAEWVASANVASLDVEYRYQLQVEDVLLICPYDTIIFADATHESIADGFALLPCLAARQYFYSSHLQTPEAILYLAKELYNKMPEAYTLAIEGKDWGLGTYLSKEATLNLQKAFSYIRKELFPLTLTRHQSVT